MKLCSKVRAFFPGLFGMVCQLCLLVPGTLVVLTLWKSFGYVGVASRPDKSVITTLAKDAKFNYR